MTDPREPNEHGDQSRTLPEGADDAWSSADGLAPPAGEPFDETVRTIQDVWSGAVDANVTAEMTIKADDLFEDTFRDADATVSDDESISTPSTSRTVNEDGIVDDTDGGTIAMDDVSSAESSSENERTIVEEAVGDRTLPDIDTEQTIGEDGVPNVSADQTFIEDGAADRTMLADDIDDGTLGDDASDVARTVAGAGAPVGDGTVMMDGGVAFDDTEATISAEDGPGTTDSATTEAGAPERTLADGPVTERTRAGAATRRSDDDGGSRDTRASTSDDGAEVGVTVRPRRFVRPEEPGRNEADYAVVRVLGEGGMGIVFEAKQTSIDRDVAVKMLKPPKGGRAQPSAKLQRQRNKFLAEAVVTGDLDHPNIVPIYDLGTDDQGAVFYSMKRVQGTPWDDVIEEKSRAENVEIFGKVTDAIAFAHSRGVVHRDLKPENVMLGGFGEVLVMDWGLALTTEEFGKAGNVTRTGSIGGTPAYMAPEMAAGDISKVGMHSDVYLLGAILFEIVTGKPPHAGRDVMKCLYAAAKNELQPTDESGELLDIALKAMATNPADRYPSAIALKEAIRDYRSHSESIVLSTRASDELDRAIASDRYEDFAKAMYAFQEAYDLWNGNTRAKEGIVRSRLAYAESAMRRGDLDLAASLLLENEPEHAELAERIAAAQRERDAHQQRIRAQRRLLQFAAAAVFAIVSVSAVMINSAREEADRQRGIAVDKQKEAEELAGQLEDQVEETKVQRDKAVVARNDAIAAREKAEDEERKARAAAQAELVAKLEAQRAAKAEKTARSLAEQAAYDSWMSQQVADLAKEDADKARVEEAVARRTAEDQRELAEQQRLTALIAEYQAALEQEAAEYASGVAELERLVADAAREEELRAKEAAILAQTRAERAAEAERLAKIEAIRAKEAEEKEKYVALIGLAAARIRENAFASARELLDDCKPELRNWEWGRLMHLASQSSQVIDNAATVASIDVSPDGTLVAWATWSGEIVIWNRESGDVVHRLKDGDAEVHAVAFSPDGKRIASGGGNADGYVKLWSIGTGKRIDTAFPGHSDAVLSVRFSKDGRRLLTGSYDETARLWDAGSGRLLRTFEGHSWWVWSAEFEPVEEKRIVTASQDGTVALWDVESGRMTASFTEHRGPVYAATFSPDGKRVVSAGYDRRVLAWNPADVKPFDFRAIAEGAEPTRTKVTEFAGHDAAVRSVRFSRDGSLIVTGGQDNTVRLWEAATGTPIKVFRGHDGWVRSAIVDPNGRWIVSAGQDATVRTWNVAEYEELRVLRGRRLEGHRDAVLAAAFSRDGKRVVTASRDRTARAYEAASGRTLQVFEEGHAFLTSSAVFFADGTLVATSAADNTTRVWDLRSGTQVTGMTNTGRSAALAVSHSGKWLLTGGDDNSMQLWNARTGKFVRRFTGHRAEVSAVAFSPDDKTIYSGDTRGTGRLWDATSGTLRHRLTGHNRRINAAVFTRDGRRVLTASGDNTVAQWDVATGRERLDLVLRHGDAVLAMDAIGDAKEVVTSSADGTLRVWNVDRAEEVRRIPGTHGLVSAVDVSADGKQLVTTHPELKAVKRWRLSDGKELRHRDDSSFLRWEDELRGVWAARFSPDGHSVLVVGGDDGRLLDAATAEERLTLSPHGAVAGIDISPDGSLIVTGSWDNSAKLWSVETGRAIRKLEDGHTGYVNAVRFSPNGRFVLTGSDDGTAKLWSVESGEIVREFAGHDGPVMHVAFSPKGDLIATSSADRTVRLWETATARTLHVLREHGLTVLAVAFSEDGRWLLTGGEDDKARLWELTDVGPVLHHVLEGHTADVTSVSFSPDRTRLLTGSRDDTVKVWDTRTGQEVLTLDGHTEEVTTVAFGPNGHNVLSGSRDGRAILWLTVPWQEGDEDR